MSSFEFFLPDGVRPRPPSRIGVPMRRLDAYLSNKAHHGIAAGATVWCDTRDDETERWTLDRPGQESVVLADTAVTGGQGFKTAREAIAALTRARRSSAEA